MSFSKDIIDIVWNKATIINGVDPETTRKDKCGATIKKNEYKNNTHINGWFIDHIYPLKRIGRK